MGRGEYHKTAAYKRRSKEGEDSFKAFLGIAALPLLPVVLPIKIASDLKSLQKEGQKVMKKKKQYSRKK